MSYWLILKVVLAYKGMNSFILRLNFMDDGVVDSDSEKQFWLFFGFFSLFNLLGPQVLVL